MIYEGLLLFGVLFIAVWIFSTLLQQRHALYLRHVLQYWLFIIIGIYFIWFWSHGGQTLAMKTWRVRLVRSDGRPVSIQCATGRYLLSWLWILPGLLVAWLMDAKGWQLVLIPAANVILWLVLTRFDPSQQFMHDRLLGTRLVHHQPEVKT